MTFLSAAIETERLVSLMSRCAVLLGNESVMRLQLSYSFQPSVEKLLIPDFAMKFLYQTWDRVSFQQMKILSQNIIPSLLNAMFTFTTTNTTIPLFHYGVEFAKWRK